MLYSQSLVCAVRALDMNINLCKILLYSQSLVCAVRALDIELYVNK